MPSYHYTARSLQDNKRHAGRVDAANLNDAVKKLRALGLLPLDLSEGPLKEKFGSKKKGVPLKEKIIFTRQLAVMIKAGLPLVKAIEALGRQTDNKYFKQVIGEIVKSVEGGQTLSSVLDDYPRVFNEIYVAAIRAGEQTGQLSEVLYNLADQQEKQAELTGKVRGALMYPAVILVALIGVIFLIVFFVLPSLQSVFSDFGGTLPLTTRLLFAFSQFARHYSIFVLPALVVLFYLVRLWVKRPNGTGRRLYDKLKISIPIFGPMTKKVYMANFSRTMAMLVKASLPILQSLKIVQKTIDNRHYDAAFNRIAKLVESGKPLSYAISQEPLFPPMVSQLTTLGEETGNLESVLQEVTRFYDSEVDNLTKNLASLIEPIMLIFMGLGVAFVVFSVLGPIYKLTSTIQ